MGDWPVTIYELGEESPPIGFVASNRGGWIPGEYDSAFLALAAALSVRYHGSPDAAGSILREVARKILSVDQDDEIAESAAAGPVEPQPGLYQCGSPKCQHLWLHDSRGWTHLSEERMVRPSRGMSWEEFLDDGSGDCTRNLIRIDRP